VFWLVQIRSTGRWFAMLGCAFLCKSWWWCERELTFPNNNVELVFSWPCTWLMLCDLFVSFMDNSHIQCRLNSTVVDRRSPTIRPGSWSRKSWAAKCLSRAETQFFEPKLQNIWAESLELQNFPLYIFQLSEIIISVLGLFIVFCLSVVSYRLNRVCFVNDNYANFLD